MSDRDKLEKLLNEARLNQQGLEAFALAIDLLDKAEAQLEAVRPLVHKWRSKPYRSEMSIKLSNELKSAIGEKEQ